MIKAYHACEKDGEYSTIVFAENATQAKTIAQSCECCENAEYIDIRVHRMPTADKLFKGSAEIDWYDDDTRIAFGWACYEPSFECDNCPAKSFCHWHGEEDKHDNL